MTTPTRPGWYYAQAPDCKGIICARVAYDPVFTDKQSYDMTQRLTAWWIDDHATTECAPVDHASLIWLGTVPIPPIVGNSKDSTK